MNKTEVVLFEEKYQCCGCEACRSICPKDAITMEEDEYGFRYPKIDKKKCINCGMCKRVCSYQNDKETNVPLDTYVAVAKNRELIMDSASGGIFAALALDYINKGGVVFGAAFDEDLNLSHICIDNVKDLYRIQGSKYVQSSIENSYKEVKKYLDNNIEVLFSGTPCQVAGLKGYLMKEYNNLLTVDIICHGVPSLRFFKDYIKILEEKIQGKVTGFKFRDKSLGWGLNGSITYKNKDGKIKKHNIYGSESSYYNYFLNSDCYRENCYSCKYANGNRCGDITIGDYWGIEKVHPELLKKAALNEEQGISVMIINTEKGKSAVQKDSGINKFISDFSKARIKNGQLNFPSKKGQDYSKIMSLYRDNGYKAVDKLYNDRIGIRKYKNRLKAKVPSGIKRTLKRYL